MAKTEKEIPMVKQKDARILREALGRVHKMSIPTLRSYIEGKLQEYARAVGSYCQCSDQARIGKGPMLRCLDCGKTSDGNCGN